jgi:hypothetical protein
VKLSKKIRQQAKTIAEQAARLDAATEFFHAEHAALRRLRDKHKSMSVRSLYGRHGSQELRCAQCTTSLYPCDTRRTLDGLLDGGGR